MKPLMSQVILAVALIAGPTEAQLPSAIGQGTASCGKWTVARGDRQAFGFEQWTLGFLSGAVILGPTGLDPLKGVNAQAVFTWMDKCCRIHPLEPIAAAARAFAGALAD